MRIPILAAMTTMALLLIAGIVGLSDPIVAAQSATTRPTIRGQANADHNPAVVRPASPPRQTIEGLVEDAQGRRQQAYIFSFDAETGLPFSNISDHPMTEDFGGFAKSGICVHTGVDGRFRMPGLFPGNYRFIAQSWMGTRSIKADEEFDGDETILRGIAENVAIAPGRPNTYIEMKPIGTASAHITFGLEGTFIFVSTSPLSGDPILQWAAWQGDFLRHLVGAAHMKNKQLTMHGLPAGKLYFYALYNGDITPAFGSSTAAAEPGHVVEVPIDVVSPMNGEITVPMALAKLQELTKDNREFAAALNKARQSFTTRGARANWSLPLDEEIAKVKGQSITWRDVATWQEYQSFNQQARELAKNARQP